MERLIPDTHQGQLPYCWHQRNKKVSQSLLQTHFKVKSLSPLGTSPYTLPLCSRRIRTPLPRAQTALGSEICLLEMLLDCQPQHLARFPQHSLPSKQLLTARSKPGAAELHLLPSPADVREHSCFPVTPFVYSDVSGCPGNLPELQLHTVLLPSFPACKEAKRTTSSLGRSLHAVTHNLSQT